jgi:dihydroneopterin aldolase
MDKIFIKNLIAHGILGIHPHEQIKPREIRVSIEASLDIRQAGLEDNIYKSLNYSTLAKKVRHLIETNRFLTIEALIETLASMVLNEDPVQKVWLRVEKPNAVPGAESVGVEISRSKEI